MFTFKMSTTIRAGARRKSGAQNSARVSHRQRPSGGRVLVLEMHLGLGTTGSAVDESYVWGLIAHAYPKLSRKSLHVNTFVIKFLFLTRLEKRTFEFQSLLSLDFVFLHFKGCINF